MTNRKIELPKQMEVIRKGGQIEIVRRWPKDSMFVGAFGAFVAWQISGSFFSFAPGDGFFQFMVRDFPFSIISLVIVLAAIWMMYFGVAGLVNRTRITLSSDGISVVHGPLPWPGNIRHARADLKQFYVKTTSERGALSIHRIQALLRNDRIVTVVNGPGLSRQQAVYIQLALQQAFRTGNADPRNAILAEAGLTISQDGTSLNIVKRWFNHYTIRKGVFSAIWLAFVGWMTWAWHTHFGARPFWPLDLDYFGLATLIQSMLLGFGVVYAYRSAADWLNRTLVTVSRENLSIRHGPLPLRGNIIIAVSSIQHLHLKESILARRAGRGRPPVYTHEVHAVLIDGRSRKLVGGFDAPVQALQLKQAIEDYLALKPVPPGAQSGRLNEAMSERNKIGLARVAASFLGLLAVAGGVFLMVSVGELHRDGATVMSQVIRGLAAFLPLSVGLMLLGGANKLKGERIWFFLFCTTFVAGAALFLLLFNYGGRPEYVINHAVVNTLPAGAQKKALSPRFLPSAKHGWPESALNMCRCSYH